jgi:hypothetical protein
MRVILGSSSEKQMPTNESMQKGYARANTKLVGKSHLRLTVGWEKMLVGKEVSVGKENVGRGRFNSDFGLSVGKYISVRKDLCRPDLR